MSSTRSGPFPRSRRALILVGVVVVIALLLVRLATTLGSSAAGGPIGATPTVVSTPIAVPPPALAAHGVVQPIARANIATLAGGTVAELSATVGQVVDKGQILARITGREQAEVVVAPWRGAIGSLAVHVGDSVLPGASIATMADLSGYQVETVDVDEYLVGRIHVGQAVTVTFDALASRSLRGSVVSISAQPQPVPGGGAHYLTIIDLPGAAPELAAGMTARVLFQG
jgi:multidrug efflux pump subunit AcrA (membrane-fusion protein)